MNPDLTEHNGRHRLRMHRRFDQSQQDVWPALVEPELLSRWYPATVDELQPTVGGAIRFSYSTAGGEQMRGTGQVTEYQEPEVLAFVELAMEDMPREGDTLLRFELRTDGPGCILLFSQEFDDRPAAAAYAAGWDACFDALGGVLSGASGGDYGARNGAASGATPGLARYEMYVHLFGLDQPAVSATEVAVERQLMMRSPEQVWRLLAPGGMPALEKLVPAGLGAGRVVEVVERERITVALPDRSRVQWELTTGPGGARLLVSQGPLHGTSTGTQWRDHVESVAEEIYALPDPAEQPS
ncbi:uncharacterized protein YndB with AHSA1/START domain [Glaciihabitans tibetensis]|uniref:Uncharacterized protein YndB with AHSA1/START domain n=2 Tax=Glaciihabitans tibetensis TaxID=1266600 RepID=A0A2T0VAY0_9MICO|nr:uncharacterized protein YndB with AHSA1/START domain [Glaciihabitans tibetensis]